MRNLTYLTSLGMLAGLAGCSPEKVETPEGANISAKDYSRPLSEGQQALIKITDPSRLPDLEAAWSSRDLFLRDAMDESITWFDKPSTTQWYPHAGVDHAHARASVVAMRELLETAPDEATFRNQLLAEFDVYESVGCDGEGTILFTGYFSPVLEGQTAPDDADDTPLFTRPDDLVTHPATGEPLGQRHSDGSIRSWPSRREIESRDLFDGSELVWVEDPLSAYIAHVNGSAKIKMEDGSTMFVGYNGKTDREYKGLGVSLVESGLADPTALNLTVVRRLYKSHPDKVGDLILDNDSYVFFREYDGGSWPAGSLGFPVTAERSIATDKSVYPRGGVVLVDTHTNTFSGQKPFTQFMLDQDTGGAIRAPGRADLYMGSGAASEILAGGQYAEGKLYYFFLKPERVAAVNQSWNGH
ncbi:MAG: MltA domain-containing protein [Phycisphaerales bacterium]|nr:MltA domain-containing protein [Phycisphaerales bacterium]